MERKPRPEGEGQPAMETIKLPSWMTGIFVTIVVSVGASLFAMRDDTLAFKRDLLSINKTDDRQDAEIARLKLEVKEQSDLARKTLEGVNELLARDRFRTR